MNPDHSAADQNGRAQGHHNLNYPRASGAELGECLEVDLWGEALQGPLLQCAPVPPLHQGLH